MVDTIISDDAKTKLIDTLTDMQEATSSATLKQALQAIQHAVETQSGDDLAKTVNQILEQYADVIPPEMMASFIALRENVDHYMDAQKQAEAQQTHQEEAKNAEADSDADSGSSLVQSSEASDIHSEFTDNMLNPDMIFLDTQQASELTLPLFVDEFSDPSLPEDGTNPAILQQTSATPEGNALVDADDDAGSLPEPEPEPEPSPNVITGTSGNDTLTGTSGVDNISGLGGNDTINGAGSADTISGGAGADIMIYDPLDTVSGGDGLDTLDLSQVSTTLNLSTQDKLSGIDEFDLGTGSGNVNTLSFSLEDILAISDSDFGSFVIFGDTSPGSKDSVEVTGDTQWFYIESDTINVNSSTRSTADVDIYVDADVTAFLFVEQGLNISINAV